MEDQNFVQQKIKEFERSMAGYTDGVGNEFSAFFLLLPIYVESQNPSEIEKARRRLESLVSLTQFNIGTDHPHYDKLNPIRENSKKMLKFFEQIVRGEENPDSIIDFYNQNINPYALAWKTDLLKLRKEIREITQNPNFSLPGLNIKGETIQNPLGEYSYL